MWVNSRRCNDFVYIQDTQLEMLLICDLNLFDSVTVEWTVFVLSQHSALWYCICRQRSYASGKWLNWVIVKSVGHAGVFIFIFFFVNANALTRLPVFTGCVHLNASSLNWQSLSTEVFTALHLGICLICCTAMLTSYQDTVFCHQPPLNWSSLCRGL